MLDLEPIKAREALATAEPWHEEYDMVWPEHVTSASDSIADCYGDNCDADLDFIIHARTDVLALIAEVGRLRALLVGVERAAHF